MTTIWHDVECGSYTADLPLWEELADEVGGPVLDLGCGTGRVALHLARRGHRVLGLDRDESLVAALRERAAELPVEAEVGDARAFDLGVEFGLVLVPMQLVQLFVDSSERVCCLEGVARHLSATGLAAIAIVDELQATSPPPLSSRSRFLSHSATKRDLVQPLPDAREVDGWVYSSLPLGTVVDDGAIVVRRLRQTVAPGGELSEEMDEVHLRVLDAAELEDEAKFAGLRLAGRREIPATGDHVGSTVVLLAKEAR